MFTSRQVFRHLVERSAVSGDLGIQGLLDERSPLDLGLSLVDLEPIG
jgi:hypothetical protein